MELSHVEKQDALDQLAHLINFVANLKTDAGHSPNGQALAVLHTDLRKCHAWATCEINSVSDDPDVEANKEPIQQD